MDISTLTAQILGIAAMIMTVISMQCRSNRKFFICQEISGTLFTASFLMFGAWGGTLMNFFGIIRPELLRRKERAKSKWVLAILILLLVICSAAMVKLANEKWYLLFIVFIAQLAGTVAMWTQNGKTIRMVQMLAVSPLWIAYNFLLPVPSIGGVLTELINITSVIIVLYRCRKTGFTD